MSPGFSTIRFCSAIGLPILLALVTAPQAVAESTPAYMDQRLARDAPLPAEMQGHWIDVDDPSTELVISGGEVACFGKIIAYDYKLVEQVDGAVTVSLKIDDQTNEDTFQRSNITELVITPDGELHAYNVKFASQFVRAPH